METRQELKKEILAYFLAEGVSDKKILTKILEKIKDSVYEINPLGWENFHPRHHKALDSFVERLEKIMDEEFEQRSATTNKTEDFLENQRRKRFRDDYEYTDVPGEVIVTPTHIEIHAFGYRQGFKEMLPKEAKYQGKGSGKWHLPLSFKKIVCTPSLLYLGCPVLFHPGCEE